MNKQGIIVIISSPSGGGKDVVISKLLSLIPRASRLVTTTTRLPRPGNREGVDYYFATRQAFEEKIKNAEMVEYNEYAGNYYGIEKNKLVQALSKSHMVFSQIDVNGKHSLDRLGIEHVSIFLVPENLDIIAQRIRNRGGVTEEKLAERLKIAAYEIEQSKDYDYRVVNREGKLDETIVAIVEILKPRLGFSIGVDKQ